MKNQVKRAIYLLGCIAGVLLFIGCKSIDDKIIGEWNEAGNTNNLHVFSMTLDKTHHASLNIGGAMIGGKGNVTNKGQQMELTYKVDCSKEPYTIKFVPTIGGLTNTEPFIQGIFRFISENKMEIRIWMNNEDRVTKFNVNDMENHTILIRK